MVRAEGHDEQVQKTHSQIYGIAEVVLTQFSSVILLPRRASSLTRQDKKLCVCLKRISQHLIPSDGVCQEWPSH